MSVIPIFTSPAGESKVFKRYQNVLDCWSAPFTELRLSTSFGETYVIASGPQGAPAIVLVHALLASAPS